jgi:hypothetical protein
VNEWTRERSGGGWGVVKKRERIADETNKRHVGCSVMVGGNCRPMRKLSLQTHLPRSLSNSFNRAVASTLPIDSNASSISSLSSVPCDSESKGRMNRRVSLWARTARGGKTWCARVWRWLGVARVRRARVCVHS